MRLSNNLIDSFTEHFRITADSMARQDVDFDPSGYLTYTETNVYGETLNLEISSFSGESQEYSIEFEDSNDDQRIITNFIEAWDEAGRPLYDEDPDHPFFLKLETDFI